MRVHAQALAEEGLDLAAAAAKEEAEERDRQSILERERQEVPASRRSISFVQRKLY